MPVVTFPRMLLTILSLLVLAGAVYLLREWWLGYCARGVDGVWRHAHGPAWRLYAGAGMVGWSFLGRWFVLGFMPPETGLVRDERGVTREVEGPDGAVLHTETFGRNGAPTLILTHGWGLDSTAWRYATAVLNSRYRVVTWDLPGLGRSKMPRDGKLTIDRFAACLGAVVQSTGATRVLLVGHSIGGMTTQTLWRACGDDVRRRVAGIVLVDTTHENPLRTMWLSPVWLALRWPLIEPLSWLTVALSPLVWLANWQSYLSGASQIAMRLTGFGKHATRQQVDLSARLACKGSPAVQAKGNLAMFRWEITGTLPAIDVPVLVLAGDKDIVTLPRASQTIASWLPRGRLVRLEGAGHMGFMERAGACNDAIARFAAEALARAPDDADASNVHHLAY
jgi:pimeloyl-ACP methyl ester carboxylesterase